MALRGIRPCPQAPVNLMYLQIQYFVPNVLFVAHIYLDMAGSIQSLYFCAAL